MLEALFKSSWFEQAMGELTAHDRSQRQARVRAAALRRLQGNAAADSEDLWQIVTPDELDEGELTECVNSNGAIPEGQSVETLVQALIQKCQIPNWRVPALQRGGGSLHRSRSVMKPTLNAILLYTMRKPTGK
jgi:hypothetical protein